MSKRIEKEPDGYVRDLLRKRKAIIDGNIALNAFMLGCLIALLIIFALLGYKPIPDELTTETHVFEKYIHSHSGATSRQIGSPAYFVSTTGEQFAISFANEDDFVKGKSYEISYSEGILYTRAYIVSDGDNEIVSLEDYRTSREKRIRDINIVMLILFGIYLLIALPVNLIGIRVVIHDICEIDEKIKKRRERRAKKE